jgi:WD40 repeat protein
MMTRFNTGAIMKQHRQTLWPLSVLTVLCVILLAAAMTTRTPVKVSAQDIAPAQVRKIVWSPSGTWLAVMYQNGEVQVLNSEDLAPVFTVQGHIAAGTEVAWSPDETMLASGAFDPDNTLRIWDAKTGTLINEYPEVGIDILSVAWKPDGSQIIASAAEPLTSSEPTLIVEVTTGELARTNPGTIGNLAWSPDLRRIAVTGTSSLVIFDASDFEVVAEYRINQQRFRPGLQSQPIALTWNHAGSLIAAGMGDGRVFLWDPENPNPDAVITLIAHDYTGTDRFTGWVHALHFDEMDQMLTAVSGDGTVRTWDIQTQRVISEQTLSPNYAADISPLGVRVANGLSTPTDVVKNPESLVETRVSNGQISLYVLNPTPAEFERVAELCEIPQAARSTLAQQLVTRDEATKAAAIDDIQAVGQHPACAADLLAVAEALLAEDE